MTNPNDKPYKLNKLSSEIMRIQEDVFSKLDDKPKEPRNAVSEKLYLEYSWVVDAGLQLTKPDILLEAANEIDALAEKLAEAEAQLANSCKPFDAYYKTCEVENGELNKSLKIMSKQLVEAYETNQRLRLALKKIKADFIPSGAKEFELAIQEMRECARHALEAEGEK